METLTVKDSRVYSLIVLYDMHTTYFRNVIEGISDNDAHNRLNTKANHPAWLVGSLVQQRFDMASMFGSDLKQGANELFENNKGIQDGVTYPSLAMFKEDWEKITSVLRNILVELPAEKLDSKFEMMPGMVMTFFELISFAIYREANCIGQLALWRRLLGYEAMKYM